jgi:hypothetical protein
MAYMQKRGTFTSVAEILERDVLPLLNLIVLLLPIVLLIVDFAAHSAIAITLPESSPNVADLDTPAVTRPTVVGDEDPTPTPSVAPHSSDHSPQPPHEAPMTTRPSWLSDSPLGYGH